MAGVKNPEKRSAILQTAVHEIAKVGLGAPTAKIARRAGVAAGTLFTYFQNKEELLNELYLELKGEFYTRINVNFPHNASPERRARHIWASSLDWAIEFPEKKEGFGAVERLRPDHARDTSEDSRATQHNRQNIEGVRNARRGLPAGFAAATMAAMQEATMEFIAKQPKRRGELIKQGFQVFWRAMR
jgi:AcrR family transcriptional regulator